MARNILDYLNEEPMLSNEPSQPMQPEKQQMLKNYLQSKMQSQEATPSESPPDDRMAMLASGIGSALAGRGPDEAMQFYENRKKLAYDKELNKLKLEENKAAVAENRRQQEIDNAFREKSLAENIASRKEIAAMNRSNQMQARAEKGQEKLQKQSQSMNEVNDRYLNIKSGIESLKSLVKEDGTFDLFGSHNAKLDQYITGVATDMAKLVDPNSVARESEVAAFKKMLFEPGVWQQDDTVQGILDNFNKIVDQRIKGAYDVRGLEMPQLVQAAQEKNSNSNSEVERLDKKSGKIAIFDAKTQQFLRWK